MRETELAAHIVAWLTDQHWDVYQEVKINSAVADIAAVRSGYLWVIECKTSLTLAVLQQANAWRCHFRSVAVPYTRNRDEREFAFNLARTYLQLGVIEVAGQVEQWTMSGPARIAMVQEREPAPLMRQFHARAKYMMANLCEEQKTYAPAGTNRGGYYTPYRRTMDGVKRWITQHPGCTLKEIMDNLDHHHYASNAGARTSIRVALESWERSWCVVEKSANGHNHYFVKGGMPS